MLFINRLKDTTAGLPAFYQPKGTLPVVWTPEFSIADDQVPDEVKKQGLYLGFNPQVYILRRDPQGGLPVLKNLSEQNSPLPATIMSYKPGARQQIIAQGYLLAVEKDLAEQPTPAEKQILAHTAAHFRKLTAADFNAGFQHELRHIKNRRAWEELMQPFHARGLIMSEKLFYRKCLYDEVSATCAETGAGLTEAEAGSVYQSWLANPRRKSYWGERGDFEAQYENYREQFPQAVSIDDPALEQALRRRFFTFAGKDLSRAIDPQRMPESFRAPSPGNSRTMPVSAVLLKQKAGRL